MTGCVLDIGSNTIRAVVYEIIGERVNSLFHKGAKSMLFDHTIDSRLTAKGMELLSATLTALCGYVADYNCEFHAFATSAFRDLENQDEVIEYIRTKNGLEIRVLSGEEEAECDYIGLRPEAGAVRGIGIDLGGGSCQILSFSEEGLTAAASLEIGTGRLARKFVSGALPTEHEFRTMYEYICSELEKVEFLKTVKNSVMFAIGGSARMALVVKGVLQPNSSPDRISVDELEDFMGFSLTPGAESILRAVAKKRYCTVTVGFIVMRAIAVCVGAESIIISDCGGVRDGYVRKYLM